MAQCRWVQKDAIINARFLYLWSRDQEIRGKIVFSPCIDILYNVFQNLARPLPGPNIGRPQ